MIRDPSDGSQKASSVEMTAAHVAAVRAKYGPNWGLTSLDEKPKASTFKPMSPEQLTAHYAKFKLGFEPKEQAE